MDRPLEASVRRRLLARRWVPLALGGVVVASGLVWGTDLLRPSVRRSSIRTARVDAGPLEASLTASGTVVPSIEHVMASPIDARVIAVLRRVGDAVKAGDPIVRLDTSASELDAEKLRQRIAIKDNEQAQAKLTLEAKLIELDGQIASKDLELQALQAALASNRSLAKEGLVSQEGLRESELKAAQAGVDLARLKQSRANAETTSRAQLDGLSLEMVSLRAEDAQQRRLLERTTTKSDRDGVLTFVKDEAGALVRQGEVLARVADLSTFRVDATTSDINASRVSAGLPVVVRLDALTTTGHVSVVEPQMQNGALRFQVSLDEASAAWLRSNLRVDVQVITDRKPRVLRVARGPFAQGGGAQLAFVLRNGRAYRTPVRFGVSNFDYFEIVEGLAEGDEIIASDMRDYEAIPELRVK
ncbi:MAG: HlyD family efflux transporter periplasmic adaptor subunit [Acidobacteria bacterium]|nr:HlyD family efflux transporter periplasmic adaptor subunit [Acidobacteriota bacterium]